MSIPTTGPGGVRFRSRLEARWAAFFSLLGWPWQYEPDLGLDGWIPDFMIASGSGVLVEVKPERSLAELVQNHKQRIEASKAVAPCVIVGVAVAYKVDDDPPVGAYGMDGGFGLWEWRPISWSQLAMKAGAKPIPFRDAQRLWVRASNALQWRRR